MHDCNDLSPLSLCSDKLSDKLGSIEEPCECQFEYVVCTVSGNSCLLGSPAGRFESVSVKTLSTLPTLKLPKN